MTERLAAFTFARRTIGAAVFSNRYLEHAETRHLPDDPKKARDTLAAFVHYIVNHLNVGSAAIESLDERSGQRVSMLAETAIESLRSLSIPIEVASHDQLLNGFGHPALRSQEDIKEICISFWPYLNKAHGRALEAAALGLYTQVERLLNS